MEGRTVEVGESCLDGGFDHVLGILAKECGAGTIRKPTTERKQRHSHDQQQQRRYAVRTMG